MQDKKVTSCLTDGKKYNINPSQIDAVGYADQFSFASHNSKTGSPVLYVSTKGLDPVSNLTVGQTYYIIDIGDVIMSS